MVKNAKNLVENALKIFEENSNKDSITGVSSGFKKLDELTYGWQSGDLIVIAGRLGMGVKSFAMSMIKKIAIDNNEAVALFSTQNTSHYHITRMISGITGLSASKLNRGRLELHEWQRTKLKLDKLSNSPIYIEDTLLSFSDFRTEATNLVRNKNVKIIVFDSLQSFTDIDFPLRNKEEEIVKITLGLKALARELNIPIIALSQVSIDVECREGSKRPKLSDLHKSDIIEQIADIVGFIYRPEYYGEIEWDDNEQMSCLGQAEFILAKHKHGGLDNIRLKFTGHLTKFSDLE